MTHNCGKRCPFSSGFATAWAFEAERMMNGVCYVASAGLGRCNLRYGLLRQSSTEVSDGCDVR